MDLNNNIFSDQEIPALAQQLLKEVLDIFLDETINDYYYFNQRNKDQSALEPFDLMDTILKQHTRVIDILNHLRIIQESCSASISLQLKPVIKVIYKSLEHLQSTIVEINDRQTPRPFSPERIAEFKSIGKLCSYDFDNHNTYRSNNKNNYRHTLVNFPHILLTHIIKQLDNNIDRICFSLVCKFWFYRKDKYLIFNNSDHIGGTILQPSTQRFTSKGYQLQYDNVIPGRYNGGDGTYGENLDSFITLPKLVNDKKSINISNSNVNEIIIKKPLKSLKNYTFKVDGSIQNLMSNQQINKLSIKCGLEMDELLPSNITKLYIRKRSTFELKYLPNQLKTLIYHSKTEIKPGELPTSLRKLKILSFREELHLQPLLFPVGLVRLDLPFGADAPPLSQYTYQPSNCISSSSSSSILPQTLRYITMSTNYISLIKPLCNLEKLVLYVRRLPPQFTSNGFDVVTVPLIGNMIPQSVTDLTIDCHADEVIFEKAVSDNVIPQNIKRLTLKILNHTSNNPDVLAEFSKLEYLDIAAIPTSFHRIISFGKLPSGIRILKMNAKKIGEFSDHGNLEVLELGYHVGDTIQIPTSIKSLKIHARFYNSDWSLPNLEHLELVNVSKIGEKKLVIPSQVHSINLVIDAFHFFLANLGRNVVSLVNTINIFTRDRFNSMTIRRVGVQSFYFIDRKKRRSGFIHSNLNYYVNC